MSRGRRPAFVDGAGFKEARLIAGYSCEVAAAALGVSVPTIRNYESGRVGVPYSAFKLMRILSGYALPGEAWQGFRLSGDTLWSPDGKPFAAADFAWWSLTCAMARGFRALHAKVGAQARAGDRPASLPAEHGVRLSVSPRDTFLDRGFSRPVQSANDPVFAVVGQGKERRGARQRAPHY